MSKLDTNGDTSEVINISTYRVAKGDDDDDDDEDRRRYSLGSNCTSSSVADLEAWYQDQVRKILPDPAATHLLDERGKSEIAICIAARLVFLREDSGLTVVELAERAGMSPNTIRAIENVKGSYGARIHTIAQLLNAMDRDIRLVVKHTSNSISLVWLSQAVKGNVFTKAFVEQISQMSGRTVAEMEKRKLLASGTIYRAARGKSGKSGLTLKTLSDIARAADCTLDLEDLAK